MVDPNKMNTSSKFAKLVLQKPISLEFEIICRGSTSTSMTGNRTNSSQHEFKMTTPPARLLP
jgi:hypothetical protein